MKKFKRISMYLMILVIASTVNLASAQESQIAITPIVKVDYAKKAKCVEVRLANLLEKKTVIRITDSKNKTVYLNVFRKKNGYTACLNLSSLKQGDYTMKISNGGMFITHPLYLSDVGVELIALNFDTPKSNAEIAKIIFD